MAEEKGRLRTFLLKAVTRHMINEHDKNCAAKRGGGQALLSLDFERAEGGYPLTNFADHVHLVFEQPHLILGGIPARRRGVVSQFLVIAAISSFGCQMQ